MTRQHAGVRHAGFSVVKLAEELATGDVYACKIMALPPLGSRTADGESTREDIFKEIEILVGLNDVNVVYLKEYFQENEKVRRGVRRSVGPCPMAVRYASGSNNPEWPHLRADIVRTDRRCT